MRSHVHLTTRDLTKGYEAGPVVDGISLKVSAGQRLGIIGENGRGKTTLLRLLAGDLLPDQGTITRHGSLSLVRQEMPFQDGETVGDLLSEALRESRRALSELDSAAEPFDEQRYEKALAHAEDIEAWDAERRADIALKALDADHDRARKLAELSVGQRYRVRLACLLAERADVLLLDEPTNHLDASALGFLTERLQHHHGVVVLVSHDRTLLDDVCTQLLDLDPAPDGEVHLHGGGYRAFKEAKRAERQRWEQRFAQEEAEHDELAERVERAQSRLRDAWRPPKGAFKHKRSTRAANKMRNVARRLEELDDQRVDAPPPPLRFQPPALEADGDLLHATPLEVPGRLNLTEPISLGAGDKLVITGPNGAGKSTLLGVLAGRIKPARGTVHHIGTVALLAQESSFADEDAIAGRLCPRAHDLGLLSEKDLARPVRTLSTGQRRRLELAILLSSGPHVLLLDEPTNHLSIALVDELTEALHQTRAAVAVATHDRQMRTDFASWRTVTLDPASQSRESSVASEVVLY
ncbi:ABC-F family ATP-binding cassette domain-containing protein [Lentzea flava]|uniref:ABC transporter ATP-binding protein n=1 Tax=Lentzea flava TaxID=103732 RepID=A0ABQ2VC44_9PSEU|nr:ABC-F family ATP-binding cassette domain-containing protein [Lentzea flava]MCP2200681.1 macrolide transport system ATP-binding/permease protein [Lentzea flava]GGU77861.1 ABC transporter ATP-binding protein [Lentzea flava]